MTIHNNIEVLADSIIGALHGADLLAVDVIDTLDSDDLAELRGAIVPVLQSAAAAPDLTAALHRWAIAYGEWQREQEPDYYRLDMTVAALEEASEALYNILKVGTP